MTNPSQDPSFNNFLKSEVERLRTEQLATNQVQAAAEVEQARLLVDEARRNREELDRENQSLAEISGIFEKDLKATAKIIRNNKGQPSGYLYERVPINLKQPYLGSTLLRSGGIWVLKSSVDHKIESGSTTVWVGDSYGRAQSRPITRGTSYSRFWYEGIGFDDSGTLFSLVSEYTDMGGKKTSDTPWRKDYSRPTYAIGLFGEKGMFSKEDMLEGVVPIEQPVVVSLREKLSEIVIEACGFDLTSPSS